MIGLLESKDKGMRWNDLIVRSLPWSLELMLTVVALQKAMEAQSSMPIDHAEFSDVIKALENEGSVKVHGERERRTIRRTGGGAIEV